MGEHCAMLMLKHYSDRYRAPSAVAAAFNLAARALLLMPIAIVNMKRGGAQLQHMYTTNAWIQRAQ